MKRSVPLFSLLALMAIASGWLMSKATWVGRVGMTFFYKEYNLLKIWWQGAAAVFVFWLLLYALHSFLHKKLPLSQARMVHFLMMLAAVGCLLFTWSDFHHATTHRMLGWRFHPGFYIVWLGWLVVCIYYLRMPKVQSIQMNNKAEGKN